MRAAVDHILNDRYRKIALTTEVKYNVARIHQHMRGAVLAPDAQGVQRETDAMNALRATNRGLLDAFDKIINVPQAREIFNAVIAARSRDLQGQKDMLALLAAGDRAGAERLLNGRIAENERVYEQTSGIGQVNQAIGQMDAVTQQNASLVEEAAAAAQSLHQQAGGLVRLVGVFRLQQPGAVVA